MSAENNNNNDNNKSVNTTAIPSIEKEVASFEGRNLDSTLPVNPTTKSAEDSSADTDTKTKTATAQTSNDKKVETSTAKTPPMLKDFDKIINPAPIIAEPKKDDKATVKDNDKFDDQQKDGGNGKPVRNLEGFSESEKLWLQRMPYDAYEYFSKQLRDNKAIAETYKTEKENYTKRIQQLEAGKQVLPESYYENPNAYVLAPEFSELQGGVELTRVIQSHWAEQLAKIERGEDWTELTNDPKTGEVILGKVHKFDASSNDKVRVIQELQASAQQHINWQGKLEGYINSFSEKHKNYRGNIDKITKENLPIFDNKESAEYKVYEQVKPIVEKQWGIRSDNPAFELLVRSTALNLYMRNILFSVANEQTKAEAVKEDQTKAGPTMSSFSAGGSGGGNRAKAEVKLSDYDNIISPGRIV